jgi:hypothetical protein
MKFFAHEFGRMIGWNFRVVSSVDSPSGKRDVGTITNG